MTESLFDVDPPEGELHECQTCPRTLWASVDQLRVLGWIAFDGKSMLGHVLHVRICPACQRKARG